MTPAEITREVVKNIGGKSGLLSKEQVIDAYRKTVEGFIIQRQSEVNNPHGAKVAAMVAKMQGDFFEELFDAHYVIWKSFMSQR